MPAQTSFALPQASTTWFAFPSYASPCRICDRYGLADQGKGEYDSGCGGPAEKERIFERIGKHDGMLARIEDGPNLPIDFEFVIRGLCGRAGGVLRRAKANYLGCSFLVLVRFPLKIMRPELLCFWKSDDRNGIIEFNVRFWRID
jgi:hypothetical protein